MRVLVTGSHGLIGSELVARLTALGHEVIRWNRKPLVSAELENIDAVVNLAGATTGKMPWTKNYKRELIESRVSTTQMLVTAINGCTNPPKVLVSGSASGFYGDTGSTSKLESDPKGTGFLSDLANEWEQAALKAKTRVVLVRTTMVLSRKLGALGKLMPILKLGIGGPMGSGKQWWDWISLPDEVGAIIHLMLDAKAEGVYNLTAPESSTCTEVVKSLGKHLGRPTVFKLPAFAARLVLGEAADELLLCNQKLSSKKLEESGYRFQHPTLESAITWVTKNPAE